MTEIDFGPEQIHATQLGCPVCGAELAVEEKSKRGKVKGDWAERFGVADGAAVMIRWLHWECSTDPEHEAFPPVEPTLAPA